VRFVAANWVQLISALPEITDHHLSKSVVTTLWSWMHRGSSLGFGQGAS
jgi:hypothetical protein